MTDFSTSDWYGWQGAGQYQGDLLEAASELFDECYVCHIPENIRFYIDYEKFARDCQLGGDMDEFDFGEQIWTCINASNI